MTVHYVELTDKNFDEEMASTDKLILIDCWNESCIVCRRMWPLLELVALKYEDKLKLAKLNVDKNPQALERFTIRGLPTFLFIKGGKLVEQVSGVQTKSELVEIIEKHSV